MRLASIGVSLAVLMLTTASCAELGAPLAPTPSATTVANLATQAPATESPQVVAPTVTPAFPPPGGAVTGGTPGSNPVACLPPGVGTAQPPQLSLVSQGAVSGANLWLFAVDDGMPQMAVSAESGGQVLMGRWDPNAPAGSVDWQVVASAADTGGLPIADHWHVYAHGYHWIVVATGGAPRSYLLKLDTSFRKVGVYPVSLDGSVPTNDMFLVAEPGGVAVGHFKPGYGHTLFRLDVAGSLTAKKDIGGGMYSHANGASALPLADGYLTLVPDTLNPSSTSAVSAIRFGLDWQPACRAFLFNQDTVNAAMPSAVRLEDGRLIAYLRVRTGASPRGAPSQPGRGSGTGQGGGGGGGGGQGPTGLIDDSGALVRLVVAPDGTVTSQETLVEAGANRPHAARAGDLVIVTWDQQGQVRYRIDKIGQ